MVEKQVLDASLTVVQRGIRIDAEQIINIVSQILQTEDVPAQDAQLTAEILVAADRRGVYSHGVCMLPLYMERLQAGRIVPHPRLRVLTETPATALLDGGNGLGQVVGSWAMQKCIEKARIAGMASIAVQQSNHFGMAAYYAMMALEHGMIGMAMTNARARVAPTRGAAAGVGTNPIAIAVPSSETLPFVSDMATSAHAYGQISVLRDAGHVLPEGWVIDTSGHAITDPALALREGLLLPLGGGESTAGYKGYSLGVMVDLLCGPLSGALFGQYIGRSPSGKSTEPVNIGHCFMAIPVESFRPLSAFQTSATCLLKDLKSIPPIEPEKPVVLPGEIEYENEQMSKREGVFVRDSAWEKLCSLAHRCGLNEVLATVRASPATCPVRG